MYYYIINTMRLCKLNFPLDNGEVEIKDKVNVISFIKPWQLSQ